MGGRGESLLSVLPERIVSKIHIRENGCWEWTGAVIWSGYGLAYIGTLPTTSPGRCAGAHRVVYEATVGLIPEGMQLDHMCHNSESCLGGVVGAGFLVGAVLR